MVVDRGLARSMIAGLIATALLGGCEGAPAWNVDKQRESIEATPAASASAPAEPQVPDTPASALADFLAAENIAETPAHRDALVDLDGDGRPELLMLLEDQNWCGRDGCTLLVFHHGESGYRLLARVTPVQSPIAVSQMRHGGWHDLLAGVGGGGTVAGTVALQFNGSGYPRNPTLLALLSPDALPPAQVVIE